MTWTDAILLFWFAGIFTVWSFFHGAMRGDRHERCSNPACRECLGDTRERLRDEIDP